MASDGSGGDHFGYSVSVSDRVIAVGAYDSGAADVGEQAVINVMCTTYGHIYVYMYMYIYILCVNIDFNESKQNIYACYLSSHHEVQN